ncbi:hypothetical protein [Streptomyces sp. NBC_01142]|uniref:hypothetical protein n=1 Tax=Streptomyces sp. NBC_01142 TaxID=2975865 RepID=UPI002B1DA489|nr:hypothetical protein [Streptomyces sp. NBC_01142]
MTTYTHRALLLALSAAAVATTPTPAAAPVARAGAAPAGGAAIPALTWSRCAEPSPAAQECAALPVPLDYRDPDGPQVTLAVSRLRSERPEARRGALLLIPGASGGSGVRQLKGDAL